MAFLPSLHDATQPDMQIDFFSQLAQQKLGQENVRSSLSVTSQDILFLDSNEIAGNSLEYSFPAEIFYKTSLSYTSLLQQALAYNFSQAQQPEDLLKHLELLKFLTDTANLVSCISQNSIHYDFATIMRVHEMSNNLVNSLHTISSIVSTNIWSLEELYIFRKSQETHHFIEENAFLIPLLREAYSRIRNYFPRSALFLEAFTDPEIYGERQLVLSIAVEGDSDAASSALDELDENWWLDKMELAQDKLLIVLEFK